MIDATLVNVVVGGLLTLAGGVGGAVVLNRLQASAERARRRAQKFEEMVTAIYDHEHWLHRFRNITLFDEAGEPGVSPMGKVEAICAIYFSQFDARVQEMSRASTAYELWVVEAKGKRLAKEQSYGEGAAEAHKPYMQSMRGLLAELRTFAHREFRQRRQPHHQDARSSP
jgi:hypothetical protein